MLLVGVVVGVLIGGNVEFDHRLCNRVDLSRDYMVGGKERETVDEAVVFVAFSWIDCEDATFAAEELSEAPESIGDDSVPLLRTRLDGFELRRRYAK
jgi:hypothetical protein